LNNLGISAWRSGDWDRSFELFDRSVRAYERSGDAVGAAMAANNAAEILSDQGRLDESIAMYRRALRTCKSARYPSGAAVITANIGQAEGRAGHGDAAVALIDEAIAQLGALGAAGYELEASVKRTEALVLAGRFDEALDGSKELLQRLVANEEDVLAAGLQRQRALAFHGAGRDEDAAQAIDDSVVRAQVADADYELGCSRMARAHITAERDNPATRSDEERGRALFERLGVVAVRAVGWPR
jgi:tetratricopeptide (TPR) repeat protein